MHVSFIGSIVRDFNRFDDGMFVTDITCIDKNVYLSFPCFFYVNLSVALLDLILTPVEEEFLEEDSAISSFSPLPLFVKGIT